MQKFELMATCASGIEALVGKELRELGYEVQVENGRVRFEGTIEDILKTNLWLRTADRIKIVVSEFEAKTFDSLFEQTKKIDWDQLLPIDASFPVEGRSRNSQLHSVPDAQAIVKKAIVNQLSDTYHRRTRLPETGAVYPIEVAINKDQVQLTLDTTGDSLFKRGYRIDKGGAPLKENMAAALVLLTSWKPDMPFIDPVCGSGTIPIEAALIGQNIAPGFNRNFICEKWDWVPAEVSEKLRDEADAQANYDVKLDITGYDIDQNMINISKRNALEAGLGDVISFKQMAVKDFKSEKLNGVIVANPPYGQRLSDQESVRKLYHEMGMVYKPLKTWSEYILTSDLEFERFYGSQATKKRKLYNGALRTDYFQYWGKPIWHHEGKREVN
ncbi:class I SAM-dependent RNA methyltransferase [Pediococcus ethanolidurans]|uniref:THUMP domain-containing class I SAM-dependent RNA methyltransferase n=1 Tax=Pediococcus ethanolidurans TaxID=319653 RepID=UPI001C1F12E1|nr:class I SAM-dependent RNA methyltransferase [Pediococcus ethanolidurans]MBU7563417.1 class I SAM-dependent RNA methyltransferase [Pediococcus ethanolidurans]MCT4398365.1 class I SAM-dependent RNA methyltransferase [Pediococcus ethanolidurans]MCV3321402.1 class I SAM-dependent RNA methyltransferase [Pediococcus ethanolidurans]MCV3323035.1 class I SAM-dependent RNA methyltransferase [Pediococcus ethanolidurans]MCV3554624.1 class I SAM-dependent RNA methyltransferase [Pediococcus ethanoliduran